MTPWQKAKAWWDENVSTETFEQTLGWHLTNGLVYSTPQAFLLARECCWDGSQVSYEGDANAWFIELAAGIAGPAMFGQFMRVADRPHKWVLWHRRSQDRVRQYTWEQLTKKLGGH